MTAFTVVDLDHTFIFLQILFQVNTQPKKKMQYTIGGKNSSRNFFSYYYHISSFSPTKFLNLPKILIAPVQTLSASTGLNLRTKKKPVLAN